MQDVKELCELIIKEADDGDAYYHYGIEYSSDEEKPTYKAYIGWSKEGLPQLMFSENSKAKLKSQMELFRSSKNNVDVGIRYHQSLIESHQRVIDTHVDIIRMLRNPQPTPNRKARRKKK